MSLNENNQDAKTTITAALKTSLQNTDKNIPITRRSRSYLLQYRLNSYFGASQGRVREKMFWFDGNLKDAVERARLHCERMNYTFLYCHPFIVDLDAQEDLKARDSEYNEHEVD